MFTDKGLKVTKAKEKENKIWNNKMCWAMLDKVAKKTPDELIEDILKVIDDAGYGVDSISYKLDQDRNHNISIDIKGCSKYGMPIEVSRLQKEEK